ncbi:hypothetical protein DFH27DRAFT_605889 [Peziza echinospora]|nr:hypothetical protein DFH27DRAFT_605889 [Peziza echinospora]
MAQGGSECPSRDILHHLESPIFKIVVIEEAANDSSLHERDISPTGGQPDKALDTPKKKTYHVHKTLLAELSPELNNHAYNVMKEGKSNTMVVHEVDHLTMELFLQWAYRQDYEAPNDLPAGGSILVHVKICALAERFNVKKLTELSASKLMTELKSRGEFDNEYLTWIMDACVFAFANLPTRPAMSKIQFEEYPKSDSTTIRRYLLNLIHTRIFNFMFHPRFEQFLSKDGHLTKCLICSVFFKLKPP